ncbi:MAG: hypothetical protein AAF252_02690 [Pseudomonadota bacterium]
MQLIQRNALLRALSACAKMLRPSRKNETFEGTASLPLTPHIAQDIGLSPSEIERLRHRWPSQSTHHPYL